VTSARSLHFVIPGDLETPTGGYGYDRRIIAGLRARGWQVTVLSLDASFPLPSPAALEHAQQTFAGLPEQALVLSDGLALGAMPQIAHAHTARLRLVALVHHPLAAERGLAPELALELARSERLALQAVRHVIVTSEATRHALRELGVELPRVSVVEPGTDAAPLARRVRGETLKMLCVATLIPRKGHDLLFTALAALKPLRWHLTCIGSLTRDPQTVARLHAQLRHLGLAERVTFAGEMNAAELSQVYGDTDLFVLPTHFEGYGMVVAEALAHGLPVVSTRVGAIADLVGADAGLLVAPGDAGLLQAALTRVVSQPGLLDTLAAGAATVRRSLPDWSQACARMAQILERQ
jgi:glycosyltransferase involved in cell wall biosynthesis